MTAHGGNIVGVTASLERSAAVRRPINFLERLQFLYKHLVMLGLPCGQFLETRFQLGRKHLGLLSNRTPVSSSRNLCANARGRHLEMLFPDPTNEFG